MACVGNASLWYWDTGGNGEAVILLHAYTGSAASWGYQQPALARAGYRVIGYSRRGHFRSQRGPDDLPGRAVDDLHALVEHLNVKQFHLVGTAAGGFVVLDYALTHPDRVLSMTVASSLGGVDEPEYAKTAAALLPPGFGELPPDFRELGPAYRAEHPMGTARWLELERLSKTGSLIHQGKANVISWASLSSIRIPALLISGDADLYAPPPMQRTLAKHLYSAITMTFCEAGHSLYWERPDAFNRTIVSFLGRPGA